MSRTNNLSITDIMRPAGMSPLGEPVKKKRGPKPGFKRTKDKTASEVLTETTTPFAAPTMPLDEHNPMLQVLAEEWEALEAQKEECTRRQNYLKRLTEKCHERMNQQVQEV